MDKNTLLRRFTKLTCFSTVFLIFAGGLVTSTGSGLSVPDWPLSYGMVFPPMVGGVFYEHGHRMIATVVGFLTLCQVILIAKYEQRRWVKNLSFFALAAVILQGILGGLTVKLFLPLPVSVSHGVLAQSFFVMTILMAYSYSLERHHRETSSPLKQSQAEAQFLRLNLVLILCIWLQLIFGAIMRHMHAGLAIMDFPTIAGEWWPKFEPALIQKLNTIRFDHNLDPINQTQVFFHILHRVWALILLVLVIFTNFIGLKQFKSNPFLVKTLVCLDLIFLIQITLGIATVLSLKEYHVASLHVVTGAITLGWSVLLFLRAAPINIAQVKSQLISQK